MYRIDKIFETSEVYDYLRSRHLLQQYKKVKSYLLSGHVQQVQFRKREPKKDGIYYFRITKKFRAIGYFAEAGVFVVVEIDDHQ